MDSDFSAERIVAALRRRFEERRRKAFRKQSAALAASLEMGSEMELRDFTALLDALDLSLGDLSRDLDSEVPPSALDETVTQIGGVGMERWLEEIRQIRKRVAAGGSVAKTET
ncbi:MAG TPA: hypothetical protein VE078_16965 [Thermoanaerobaculia bacterium]|nr:hypothetical protein [Thermoanaerobaculia bacterium]